MILVNILSFCLLSWISLSFPGALSKRIGREKIYVDIETKYFCYRRLNATHQVGCQSKGSGNVGVLDLVKDPTDLSWVVAEGKDNPYIPVLKLQDFTARVMSNLSDSQRISGVIVISEDDSPLTMEAFSPETSCPNDRYSLYNSPDINTTKYAHCSAHNESWNPENPALNLLFEDFDFPVLLLTNATDIANIKECVRKYGRSEKIPHPTWPLCSAQIYTRMKAAKDARTCMRRNNFFNPLDTQIRYCDPLNSYNIFAPLLDLKPNQTLSPRSLTILASRMDAISFFYEKTPGADSAVTGLTVLLSVVETLSRIKNSLQAKRKEERNVLFTLFNGEAFDYIGSGRMAYDMKKKQFEPQTKRYMKMDWPHLEFDNIANFIELSQLAPYSNSKDVWVHSDPLSQVITNVSQSVERLIDLLTTSSLPISVKSVPGKKPLPPASLQSFLREDPSVPGVVLTNHEKKFENKFYHSFLDNYLNVGFNDSDYTKKSNQVAEHLAHVSSLVSQTIYTILTDEKDPSIKSNASTIHDILYCFLINSTCPYFANYFSESDLQVLKGFSPLPLYISGYTISPQYAAWWIREIITVMLGDFLGVKTVNITADECIDLQRAHQNESYDWIPLENSTNVTCIKSPVFLSDALSPVFLTDEPDWNLNYSTWTESYWETPFARIFLQPGRTQEGITLLTGLFVAIFSFLIVKFLHRYNGVIFKVNENFSGANLIMDHNVQC